MAGFIQFIRDNFAHVAPLLGAAAFAIVIIIERTRALVWGYPMQSTEAFFERIRNLVMSDKINEAVAFCERYWKKPVARVVKEGLTRADQPESLIENGLQITVGEVTQTITARTGFLATIANVATLLGLLEDPGADPVFRSRRKRERSNAIRTSGSGYLDRDERDDDRTRHRHPVHDRLQLSHEPHQQAERGSGSLGGADSACSSSATTRRDEPRRRHPPLQRRPRR